MEPSCRDATNPEETSRVGARSAARKVAICCRGLRKVYDGKVEAVRRLDLEIYRGECFGLLGPNGAGKTTTIEILEGLLAPSSGEVEILGSRWGSDDKTLRQRLGISLQETRLSAKLTVRETLRLFRSFYDSGLEPDEAIERVSMTAKADARVGKLSGGQTQRLAVACALIGDPELLFLDEPTSGLDPQSRRQVWSIIRDFQRRGRTVLITTHYMDEAERLCDRVAIVDQGEMIALDSPRGLVQKSLGGDHMIELAVTPLDGRAGAGHDVLDAPGAAPEPVAVSVADPVAAAELIPIVEELETVRSVRSEDGGLSLNVQEPHQVIPRLLELAREKDLEIVRLTTRHASLEDVFVKLTGRHLRDDAT